jgi:hypothetical protein
VSRFIFFIVCFYVFGLATVSSTSAQEDPQKNKSDNAEASKNVDISFEQELTNFYAILKEKEKEKRELTQRLKKEADTLTRQQLVQELASVEDIIIGVRSEIVSVATNGMTLFAKPPVDKKDFNWQEDLKLIFEPLLDQLRGIGERPRLIAKLETDIVFWNARKKELTLAVENLTENLKQLNDSILRQEVQRLLNSAASRKNRAEQKLSLLNKDLVDLKKSESTIWSSLGEIFREVIIGILLHLMIAVAAAIFVYQCIRLLSLIPIQLIRKNTPQATLFAERAIVFGRVVIGIILMVLSYFVVLYSFNEWLLIVLSLLIIAGLILALKNTAPDYIIEIKALLNMGSIRQGERLIYHGLPWRISKLNVHTHLSNPALGSSLRVPLSEIVNLSSRESHVKEPWFPTKVGDVVLLEDGVFGKITRQTLELVEINFGGSIFSYQTLDFLTRRPQNLSKEGFSVYETFGFDYLHQSIATGEMLKTYKAELAMAMKKSDYSNFNTFLTVEFANASASSLDFRVIASFDGDVAADFYRLKRFLQESSVNIANKHGWIIPFQQLTVHHVAEK